MNITKYQEQIYIYLFIVWFMQLPSISEITNAKKYFCSVYLRLLSSENK